MGPQNGWSCIFSTSLSCAPNTFFSRYEKTLKTCPPKFFLRPSGSMGAIVTFFRMGRVLLGSWPPRGSSWVTLKFILVDDGFKVFFNAYQFTIQEKWSDLTTLWHSFKWLKPPTNSRGMSRCMIMAIQPTPPPTYPPRNKALLRAYYPLVSLNKALLNPYFWGGYVRGGWLNSHDMISLAFLDCKINSLCIPTVFFALQPLFFVRTAVK